MSVNLTNPRAVRVAAGVLVEVAALRSEGEPGPLLELRLYRLDAATAGFAPSDVAVQVPLVAAPDLARAIRKTAREALWALACGANEKASE
jgi:hypothetical protein